MARTRHDHFIQGSYWDRLPIEKRGPKLDDCGGPRFCTGCFDDVQTWKKENIVSINHPKAGAGWYEFIHPFNVTTHIVYVRENGELYFPEAGLTAEDLTLAAARGQSYRLVRADDVDTL